jgi:S-adenosylmethionine decarboxylase proenzyme
MLKNKLIKFVFTLAIALFGTSLLAAEKEANDLYSQKSSHLLLEYNGCNVSKLNNKKYLEDLLTKAAVKGKFTVLNSAFHQFEPQGVTGVILLSESHMSIHTWPEHGYAAVDLFTCGQNNSEESEAFIRQGLECKYSEKMLLKRGDGIQVEYHSNGK